MTETRASNRRGEGARLREELIAAAGEPLLERQPLDLPSLRSVAKRVGVAPSAVYLHFASAEELRDAVIEAQFARMRSAIAFETSERTLADQASAYVNWGLHNPGAYQLLFEFADRFTPGRESRDNRIGWDLIADLETALVRAGLDEKESPAIALRMWSRLHGLVSLRIHKPDVSWPTSAAEEAMIIIRDLVLMRPDVREPHG